MYESIKRTTVFITFFLSTFDVLMYSLNPLVAKQKSIRTITYRHYHEHISPLFKELKLLKMKNIYQQTIVFTYKAVHKMQ